MNKFIVGSKYWFSSFDDFKPHDTDYLIFDETINDTYSLQKKMEMITIFGILKIKIQ